MGFKDYVGDKWNQASGFVGEKWGQAKNYGGQAWDWAWKHKKGIIGTVGGGMSVLGTLSGNPIATAAGNGLVNVALAMKDVEDGEAKDSLEKALKNQINFERMKMFGSKSVAYSDVPRIHYSAKPPPLKYPAIKYEKPDKKPETSPDQKLAKLLKKK